MYPVNWVIEWDDNLVSIYHPDGEGVLQISSYTTESENKDIDIKNHLQAYLENNKQNSQVVEVNNWAVADLIDSDNKYWRYWLFKSNEFLIFATYNCDRKHIGKEDKEINEILQSVPMN